MARWSSDAASGWRARPDETIVVPVTSSRTTAAYGAHDLHPQRGRDRPAAPARSRRWGLARRRLRPVRRAPRAREGARPARARVPAIPGELRLVLAGGSSFTDEFVGGLERRAADPRIILAGYVYGEQKDELYTNAAAFVLPSLLEGLPLTLLEATSYGTPVVASDIPPHLEVIGTDGPGRRLVAAGDDGGLSRALAHALGTQGAERAGADAFGREVLSTYRWDEVADATEEVYRAVTRRSRGT